ncbi:hypothetical protein EHRUM1_03190 [Ehrlichia ruminantium]|uniref:DUF2610 domain-containing protein n=1 Tax=Ehrlichia ruminantium TaxID=779 RepID=A0A170RT31_EHRRU|nr:DUF2610 domain-containing protein [Ehrlichia ruminantium]QLK52253.1 DUF2610 domain-containing protein [Ehrlichia ruminantium]QLK54084.1 DUF2610 domain-containing protein [Ehrlichia ruminantium]QLK56835.1 DUF2610 domain-containing protein [Ehrlichia ruminantium]CAI27783.1 Conserved hypothetical protein [Ehrlichia ruminantium str. Gardel]GAT75178.1 hypothetical protein EHRUM4_03860 [Ehrlichia ruminantium]
MPGVKKFIVPCNFNGQNSPFAIYIGEPKPENHPIQHQDNWLAKERGGNIPEKIKDSLSKLYALAQKNGICFADLCVYALTVATHKNNKNSSDNQ